MGVRAGVMIPVGWIGIAANATYYAMLDFLAGCVGLDPRKDDYHKPSANVVANAHRPKPSPSPRRVARPLSVGIAHPGIPCHLDQRSLPTRVGAIYNFN